MVCPCPSSRGRPVSITWSWHNEVLDSLLLACIIEFVLRQNSLVLRHANELRQKSPRNCSMPYAWLRCRYD